MSASLDSSGNRIVSDILIAGFTHESTIEYNIAIPDEIIGVIVMFWFVDVCDEWDKSLADEAVIIDGQCVKLEKSKMCTIFGTKSVTSGSFE